MHDVIFGVLAYALLAGLGFISLAFLAVQLYDRLAARRKLRAVEWRSDEEVAAEAAHRTSVATEPPRPTDPAPSGAPAATDGIEGRSISRQRARLQNLLNRGVRLEQGVRDSFGLLSMAQMLEGFTQQEDVDAWEADVEAELADRPREIALFKYEPRSSPLAGFTFSVVDNPLRKRLRQRNQQLETIIKRMR